MEIIESNKRNAKICYNGFMYTKHASRKNKMWWKCVKRSSGHCQGSMTTDLNRENPSIGLPHNHAPDETQIRLAKVRNWMKTQAINTRDKPAQIFSHGVSQCHDDVRSLIPSEETCKRTLRNQRRSPPVPRLLQDLGALPIEFCQTIGPNPKEFLLYDNGPNKNNRILVFGTHEGLRLLAASDTLHMDGNFAMAPNIFKQIYVIRVPFGNAAVTLVYALLPNKISATYQELFQFIVDKCADLNYPIHVQKVVTDFEDGVLRAVLAVFGRNIESKGCFYHLAQSTWRKIQELGLASHYNNKVEFRQFCGMIDRLAFLPLEDVGEGMRYLKTVIPQDPPEAEDLLMYFDRTYVSGFYRLIQESVSMSSDAPIHLRMRRIPPMFAPCLWNVHDATMNNNARTNNICEGWNSKFFNLVGHYHPSVWRVIEWFQLEESTVSTIIHQDAVGNHIVRQIRKKYVQLQERLHNLCVSRREGQKTVAEFLHGVGWNIRLHHEH